MAAPLAKEYREIIRVMKRTGLKSATKIADVLKKNPPAVSQLLYKMVAKGLVEKTPYAKFSLVKKQKKLCELPAAPPSASAPAPTGTKSINDMEFDMGEFKSFFVEKEDFADFSYANKNKRLFMSTKLQNLLYQNIVQTEQRGEITDVYLQKMVNAVKYLNADIRAEFKSDDVEQLKDIPIPLTIITNNDETNNT